MYEAPKGKKHVYGFSDNRSWLHTNEFPFKQTWPFTTCTINNNASVMRTCTYICTARMFAGNLSFAILMSYVRHLWWGCMKSDSWNVIWTPPPLLSWEPRLNKVNLRGRDLHEIAMHEWFSFRTSHEWVVRVLEAYTHYCSWHEQNSKAD